MKWICIILYCYIVLQAQGLLEHVQWEDMETVQPNSDVTIPQDALDVQSLSHGFSQPRIEYFQNLDFPHRGVSMPQWSFDGKWLAVQYKPVDRRTAYALRLFYFQDIPYTEYDLQETYKASKLFHSFCWSPMNEFCAINANFQLYWGQVETNTKGTILMHPLLKEQENITHPSWIDQDHVSYIVGSQIHIARLTQEIPRKIKESWQIQSKNISSVFYFRPYKNKILLSGNTYNGASLHILHLSEDYKTIIESKELAQGIFKLPEWNQTGTKALIYELKNINEQSAAQEMYLYLYTLEGYGPILPNNPTIQNQEKEPQHDYLGATWATWKGSKGENLEGTLHFFKQIEHSTSGQTFNFVTFSNPKQPTMYETISLDMNQFPIHFGRGRRIAFARNNSPLVAYTYYDAGQQKTILYIALLNFFTR
ncbi:MAG: hypothetical protein KBC30_05165 [Planctomycetes bacterium]|nr:hypothetical protein [Planctomycetota bacterium]HNZ65925.1 hypothetical protein [Planctomycetota bacterium]HPY74410.1 hypothetical protein [Planctomycetota bacterium]HQA99930.1 hypothetical protein [Planctomycetota bacterium]